MRGELSLRLGRSVRQLRERRGLTQEQMARLAGLPRATWTHIESGGGNPTLSVLDRVATYEVDDNGDPIVGSRKDFFTSFPRPWGAYFEPVTGDYIFLTWGGPNPPDRVFIVQGFAPPPPPPEPPM